MDEKAQNSSKYRRNTTFERQVNWANNVYDNDRKAVFFKAGATFGRDVIALQPDKPFSLTKIDDMKRLCEKSYKRDGRIERIFDFMGVLNPKSDKLISLHR